MMKPQVLGSDSVYVITFGQIRFPVSLSFPGFSIFNGKTWKTQGNCKMFGMITDEVASMFSLLPCSGKN